jgi:hypothetical protein
MSAYTPGPWVWEVVKDTGLVPEWTLIGPDVLCRYWYDNPPSADARLIAAAPTMLAALERAAVKLDAYVGVCKGDKELTGTIIPMARDAIAKAMGDVDAAARPVGT